MAGRLADFCFPVGGHTAHSRHSHHSQEVPVSPIIFQRGAFPTNLSSSNVPAITQSQYLCSSTAFNLPNLSNVQESYILGPVSRDGSQTSALQSEYLLSSYNAEHDPTYGPGGLYDQGNSTGQSTLDKGYMETDSALTFSTKGTADNFSTVSPQVSVSAPGTAPGINFPVAPAYGNNVPFSNVCSICRKTISRRSDMKRHMLTHDKTAAHAWKCPMATCVGKRGFSRKDKLNDHLESAHGVRLISEKGKGKKKTTGNQAS